VQAGCAVAWIRGAGIGFFGKGYCKKRWDALIFYFGYLVINHDNLLQAA